MPSLRDLAWELRRYGFTQLRHTTHGILYGKGELRFSLVNEVNQKDAIGVSNQADKAWNDWGKLVKEHGLQATMRFKQAPVVNPEDIKPVDNPEEGMPELEPIMTPAEVKQVVEEVVPPNEVEEDEMKKLGTPRKRREYKGVTCPKCGKHFKHMGKHAQTCDGSGKTKKQRAALKPLPIDRAPISNGTVMAALQLITKELPKMIGDMEYELKLVRKERDELATWKNNFQKFFEVKK